MVPGATSLPFRSTTALVATRLANERWCARGPRRRPASVSCTQATQPCPKAQQTTRRFANCFLPVRLASHRTCHDMIFRRLPIVLVVRRSLNVSGETSTHPSKSCLQTKQRGGVGLLSCCHNQRPLRPKTLSLPKKPPKALTTGPQIRCAQPAQCRRLQASRRRQRGRPSVAAAARSR